MRTIYKYHIAITDTQLVSVPKGAIFRHVGLDPNREPCVWAEVNTDELTTPVKLYIIGTGNPMPCGAKNHIGSFNMGAFMWHLYV